MIKIYSHADPSGQPLEFKSLIMPGGEPHVELTQEAIRKIYRRDVMIDARITSMDEFGTLLVLTDAVRQYSPVSLDLFIPYFPGARQDKREEGFGLTAKVFADVINMLNYGQVLLLDPHSPVVEAVVNRSVSLELEPYACEFLKQHDIEGLICPDVGARSRVEAVARYKRDEPLPIIYCDKSRDAQTGELSGFYVGDIPFSGRWAIVDDICDGGGTFNGIAEEFRSQGEVAEDVSLYLWTTHGIYSKGTAELLKYFHTVGCTDSYFTQDTDPLVHVIPTKLGAK